MEIKQMIEVLQAAERGEEIECKLRLQGHWQSTEGFAPPEWNFASFDYRVKPSNYG